jgi:hypothetical protein
MYRKLIGGLVVSSILTVAACTKDNTSNQTGSGGSPIGPSQTCPNAGILAFLIRSNAEQAQRACAPYYNGTQACLDLDGSLVHNPFQPAKAALEHGLMGYCSCFGKTLGTFDLPMYPDVLRTSTSDYLSTFCE